MEKIKGFFINVIIGIWFIIALFSTICLLSLTDFGTMVFGKNTLIIMDSDELEPTYNEGDLLLIKRGSDNKIEIGENVFYYNSAMNSTVLVYFGEVQNKEPISKSEVTYTIENEKVSSEYIIGAEKSTKVFKGMGTILGVITSQWGFLFFILFPMLFAIIYEIMMIVDASKKEKELERKGKESENQQ